MRSILDSCCSAQSAPIQGKTNSSWLFIRLGKWLVGTCSLRGSVLETTCFYRRKECITITKLGGGCYFQGSPVEEPREAGRWPPQSTAVSSLPQASLASAEAASIANREQLTAQTKNRNHKKLHICSPHSHPHTLPGVSGVESEPWKWR